MAASATAIRKTTTFQQQAAVLLMMCVWAAAATTSSGGAAAAPAVDCSSLVLTMADCLSFVSNGSAVEKPEGTCCAGLKTVLKADAECICEAFRNSAQLGVILNVTKAMALPAACKVSASSATNCQLSVAPASSPDTPESSSPTADSSSSTTAASPSSSTGTDQQVASDEVSAPAPAPAQGFSASSSLTPSFASFHIFYLLLAALFFFST